MSHRLLATRVASKSKARLRPEEEARINDCFVLQQRGNPQPLSSRELVVCLNSLGIPVNCF
jgi:hypothetical protein